MIRVLSPWSACWPRRGLRKTPPSYGSRAAPLRGPGQRPVLLLCAPLLPSHFCAVGKKGPKGGLLSAFWRVFLRQKADVSQVCKNRNRRHAIANATALDQGAGSLAGPWTASWWGSGRSPDKGFHIQAFQLQIANIFPRQRTPGTVEHIITVQNLCKNYGGIPVVDHISFQVRSGECFGILGPNGAGKTTTLRMLIGLTPLDGGVLEILGLPMHPDQRSVSQHLGVISQENNLDDDLSVQENILVYGHYFGLGDKVIRSRLEELLAFALLTDRRHQPVRTLSGGMKRRLVLARSLVAEPKLVILDEPTTGLDPQARHLIWQRLRTLKEKGVTLLLTTHYMEEAAHLCDRLLVMNRGHILDLGSPRELIARHVEPEVVEIRSCGGRLDPTRLQNHSGRQEIVGDLLYCYAHDTTELLATLRTLPDLTFLARPANLEDLFLKLTGHDLRE
ncbi:MAG: ATP-binding cassette domain-containing protein [Magnetococcales bacterium]|nr:ATP-binding cassette domain-containing protein [Magnetococcales bacterium]MBF0321819.1 ATP-binding cassette domain-containing protein [Magnetococcales bacterium]